MNIFKKLDIIEVEYDKLNYDQKAEFSNNIKTARTCANFLFWGGIGLVVFAHMVKNK